MATKPAPLTRRDFLRLTAAGLGSLAAGPLLNACTPARSSPTATPIPPTATLTRLPTAKATPGPTATVTATPQSTLVPSPLPEIIRFYPTVPSKVIQTHLPGVWSNKSLNPAALHKMLDASITKLTGLNDVRESWAALFKPGEKILIKVNTFSNSIIWTHAPLVQEVTNSLQEAGIPADNITIFDYTTQELDNAHYTVNVDGPGVRCTGMDQNYSAVETIVKDRGIKLANLLQECDALINIPILKSHMMSGITFAMKNHYGSFSYPDLLHDTQMLGIAALNAIPEIRGRTRMIIGDALSANLHYANSWPYWQEDWYGDSIFMSFDPVAHDTMGLQLLARELEKSGDSSDALTGMATPYLEYAAELGLGTNEPANMEVIEQTLT